VAETGSKKGKCGLAPGENGQSLTDRVNKKALFLRGKEVLSSVLDMSSFRLLRGIQVTHLNHNHLKALSLREKERLIIIQSLLKWT
jgi:hypothetical protein